MNNPHAFTLHILKWHYCAKCGLVRLNNAKSISLASKSCPEQ
jgi:hypothetical protein